MKRVSSRAALLIAISCSLGATSARADDALKEGFRSPPQQARPRVWWHWMNGNISAHGAVRDLEWFHRIGIGGAQVFEAGMGAQQVVPERLIYMSPPWKNALRVSAETAQRLGLDLGIATSPGWSATGGPWVKPEDAMKKLVWSATSVKGGPRIITRLARPSGIAGPYQDIPLSAVEPGAKDTLADFYRDARVVAYRTPVHGKIASPTVTASIGTIDVVRLNDQAWGPTIRLAPGKSGDAWLLYDYGRPQEIRSLSIGMPALRGFGAPKSAIARLETSDDGKVFREITVLPPSTSPVRSASFAPVTARWFRVRFSPDESKGFLDGVVLAPSAIPLQLGPPPSPDFLVSEVAFDAVPRVTRSEEKTGYATVPDYYAVENPDPGSEAQGVDPASVIDLTQKMAADGSLDWTPPAGAWTVLRMGWSPTGHQNGPAPEEASGLEVDKLSKPRVTAYIDHYLATYRTTAGDGLIGATGIRAMLSDSIEAGSQTWTDDMPAQFRRLRGYDITPWLPALTGTIVGDAARTDRFLWDWRKTIADLYGEAHYATLADAAKRNGMTYYAEALEDHRPQLGDDMAMRTPADVPMGAMWMIPRDGESKATYIADLKGAASVANLYDKGFVGAESLTAFGRPFAFAPADLKSTADMEFALGVTRMIIHTSAHQPLPDAAPGLTLAPFLGQYFTRNETWAEQAKPWIDYLSRSAFLLQQGRHAADIAYFYGEEAPLTGLYGDLLPTDIPVGHDYDFVNADSLATRLKVIDGMLVTPGGVHYSILHLGGSSNRVTLGTLIHIRDLVMAGAIVVGKRPTGSPSLADNDRAVTAITDALWGAPGETGVRAVGRGKLYRSGNDTEALADLKLERDWNWRGSDARLAVLHRALSDGDLYFISNRKARAETGVLKLRVAGRVPELWHADTGRIEPTSWSTMNGVSSIPLKLAPDDALFVVFRKTTAQSGQTVALPKERRILTVRGLWKIGFQAGRGAPPTIKANLSPWNTSTIPGVRFFSGIGNYTTTVEVSAREIAGSERLLLDLGEVHDVATVTVNNVPIGTAWKAPYRVDVTAAVHPGINRLRVDVSNLWVNRLIGDQQPGAVKIAHVTGPTYSADALLLQSGLIGPVSLIALDQP